MSRSSIRLVTFFILFLLLGGFIPSEQRSGPEVGDGAPEHGGVGDVPALRTSSGNTAEGWSIEPMADGRYSSWAGTVIELDSDDVPQVGIYCLGYPSKVLKWGRLTRQGWLFEDVDQASPAIKFDFAIASDDSPHFAYFKGDGPVLTYSYREKGRWVHEEMDTGVTPGNAISLAMDDEGNPLICFCHHSGTESGIFVASFDGTEWDVDVVSVDGVEPSMMMDEDGGVHIVFYDNTKLYYAQCPNNTWKVESCNISGLEPSLALNGTGTPAITYRGHVGEDGQYVAVRTQSGWETSLVDALANAPRQGSLDFGPDGRAHVSYCDGLPRDNHSSLDYGVFDGSKWKVQELCEDTTGEMNPSLRMDSAGDAHIAFFYEDILHYATTSPRTGNFTGGGPGSGLEDPHGAEGAEVIELDWNFSTVEVMEYARMDCSIELDSAGAPHVAYADANDVKHARLSDGEWVVEEIAYKGGLSTVDQFDLEIDGLDRPRICHSYSGHDLVSYAFWNGAGWTSTDAGEGADLSRNIDMGLEDGDVPHVVFSQYQYEIGGGTLHHSSLVDGVWNSTVISDWVRNEPVTIVIDDEGTPHLSYSTHAVLYGVIRDGVLSETVVAKFGSGSRLGMDEAGTMHVGYITELGEPMHAVMRGDRWKADPIGSTGPIIGNYDMALGPEGRPHFLYGENMGGSSECHKASDSVLYYSYQVDGEWVRSPVFRGLNCSQSSLTIGPDGTPHIAYMDAENGTLIYATTGELIIVNGQDGEEDGQDGLDDEKDGNDDDGREEDGTDGAVRNRTDRNATDGEGGGEGTKIWGDLLSSKGFYAGLALGISLLVAALASVALVRWRARERFREDLEEKKEEKAELKGKKR